MRSSACLVALCLFATVTVAQDLGPRSKPQETPVAIVGATVHPVSGPSIPDGCVIFAEGRVTHVRPRPERLPEGTRVVDATGKHVYPGFIAPYSRIGLTEIGSVRATRDFEEVGDVKPEVRAAVAVNPDSTLIPVARSNGILTAALFPSGGAIPGRVSILRMDGWTWESMTIEDDAGLAVGWPGVRPIRAWWMDKSEEEQRKENERRLRSLREAFVQAGSYHSARISDRAVAQDVRWDAMRSVLPIAGDDQRPVFFEANEVDQIRAALRFARKHRLRPVVVGGRDAPFCLPLLKEHAAKVIVTGTYEMPHRADAPVDERFRLPSKLEAAGIPWCLASGQPASNERNLPYAAAMAVAHGLDADVAIRAITLSAAEILGVADRLGSLEPGKAATLIVTDGDPLEIPTNVTAAFVDGREISLENKQTALADKYRHRD